MLFQHDVIKPDISSKLKWLDVNPAHVSIVMQHISVQMGRNLSSVKPEKGDF